MLILMKFRSCCTVAMARDGKRCPICRTRLPYQATARELRHGDRVRLFSLDEGPFMDGTVVRVTQTELSEVTSVTVLRPYVHTSNFVCADGVIPYLGWEEVTLFPETQVIVLEESSISEVVRAETDEGRRARARA